MMLKQREQRVNCVLAAKMRVDSGWQDICIRNISPRGMLIQMASPPPRASYVEVHRGEHVVVARVSWVKKHRLGLEAQERLDADAITTASGRSAKAGAAAEHSFGKRSRVEIAANPDHGEARSRHLANRLQFACVAVIGAAGALTIGAAVSDVLSVLVTAVATALGG